MKFDGVLFFPVTPFTAEGAVDVELLKEHISSRLPFGPGGVFPACGTGEFHALSIEEVRTVVVPLELPSDQRPERGRAEELLVCLRSQLETIRHAHARRYVGDCHQPSDHHHSTSAARQCRRREAGASSLSGSDRDWLFWIGPAPPPPASLTPSFQRLTWYPHQGQRSQIRRHTTRAASA